METSSFTSCFLFSFNPYRTQFRAQTKLCGIFFDLNSVVSMNNTALTILVSTITNSPNHSPQCHVYVYILILQDITSTVRLCTDFTFMFLFCL